MDEKLIQVINDLNLSAETVSEIETYISNHPDITVEQLRAKILSIVS